jgi:hypothetical protein
MAAELDNVLMSERVKRVAFFRETGVAAVNNFTAPETRLLALGMIETNDIPSRALSNPKSTRTWTSHAFPANRETVYSTCYR